MEMPCMIHLEMKQMRKKIQMSEIQNTSDVEHQLGVQEEDQIKLESTKVDVKYDEIRTIGDHLPVGFEQFRRLCSNGPETETPKILIRIRRLYAALFGVKFGDEVMGRDNPEKLPESEMIMQVHLPFKMLSEQKYCAEKAQKEGNTLALGEVILEKKVEAIFKGIEVEPAYVKLNKLVLTAAAQGIFPMVAYASAKDSSQTSDAYDHSPKLLLVVAAIGVAFLASFTSLCLGTKKRAVSLALSKIGATALIASVGGTLAMYVPSPFDLLLLAAAGPATAAVFYSD